MPRWASSPVAAALDRRISGGERDEHRDRGLSIAALGPWGSAGAADHPLPDREAGRDLGQHPAIDLQQGACGVLDPHEI